MQIRLLAICLLAATVSLQAEISAKMFRHHYITREVPGRNLGMGSPTLADFDKDGDLDFAFLNRGDKYMYWFEQQSADDWVRHVVAEASGQLGSAVMDVDGDGWIDILIGGNWYRNPGNPREARFTRYTYDSRIQREIHDMVVADVDGDGRDDIVALGDRDGCFWYSVPGEPNQNADWPRVVITLGVLNDRDDTHAGPNPNGVGDLDGDGDADIMLTDRWAENVDNGKRWIDHRLLFGKRGPWGFSARSWIIDLDKDGDNDIVFGDCDGQNSGVGWIENRDGKMDRHWPHYFANRAPGTRGSYHSLRMADFDSDGDLDILIVEQEDPAILPQGATPRWYIWENLSEGSNVRFEERVILDDRLGGHDVLVGDVDGDGDLDIASKIWSVWDGNSNGGKAHADWLENLSRD